MNITQDNVGQIRHTLLDSVEFKASICQLGLPTWGFKDVNHWFETLESAKYVTPNGFISYDKKGVYFESSVDNGNSRNLFELGQDNSNYFEMQHTYRTWMFLRFAPLSCITSREMSDWAQALLQ